MSWKTQLDRKETLMGKADLGRVIWPSIRGSIRRLDPGGGNPEPHITGLNGTSLTVRLEGDFTGNITINFVSDSYGAAIALINSTSPTHLKAEDDNGYLRVRSLHAGNKNLLKITAGAAAALIGYELDPLPGSVSFAGEFETTATGWPVQNLDQLTRVISKDEGMNSMGFNRSVGSVLTMVDAITSNMDREVALPKKYDISVVGGSFTMGQPVDRLYIEGSTTVPGRIVIPNPTADVLDKCMVLLDQNDDQVFVNDTRVRITSVTYGALVNAAQSFVTWGTPDGKSVFGNAAHWDKAKDSGAITDIKGNMLILTGTNLITRKVRPGDTAIISTATNLTPFSHNGEFLVEEVIDATHCTVKPKGTNDFLHNSAIPAPAALNNSINRALGESYGVVTFPVGRFVPFDMQGAAMTFNLTPAPANGSYRVVLPIGRTVRSMLCEDINLSTTYRPFGAQIEVGSKLLANATDPLKPRIISPISANQLVTLMQEWPAATGGGNVPIRLYAGSGGSFGVTVNCFWTGAAFQKDVNGVGALQFYASDIEVGIGSKLPADNANWVLFDNIADFPTNDRTATSLSKFYNGINTGIEQINTIAKALVPRVKYTTRTTESTLLTETTRGTTVFREYHDENGRTVTLNAARNAAANWVRDVNDTVSLKWVYTANGMYEYVYNGTLNTFNEPNWTSRDDFRSYIIDDDFVEPWTSTGGNDVNITSKWVTGGGQTNTSVVNPPSGVGQLGFIGTLSLQSAAAGAFDSQVFSRWSMALPGTVDFILKFRVSTPNKADLTNLAGEGFFIGLKDPNDTPPPDDLRLCGIATGSGANWNLKTGDSGAPVHADLGINDGSGKTFYLEKFGGTLKVYMDGALITSPTFTGSYNHPVFAIEARGNAGAARAQAQVDFVKIWFARPF